MWWNNLWRSIQVFRDVPWKVQSIFELPFLKYPFLVVSACKTLNPNSNLGTRMTGKGETFKTDTSLVCSLLWLHLYLHCTHFRNFVLYHTPIFPLQSNCGITCCIFSFQLIALKLLKLNEKVRAPKSKQLRKTQVQVNKNAPWEIIHNQLLSELTGLDIFGLKQCNS